MKVMKILITDDHAIVRKGLRSLLEAENGVEIIAEADSGREAVELAKRLNPDVVLMDISMPGLNGLEATRQIKKELPDTKVLILTMHSSDEYVFEVLNAGASGYVLKQSATSELIFAVQAVFQGMPFLSPSISGGVIEGYLNKTDEAPQENSYASLTKREREVLQLIAEGNKTRSIAELLNVSIKTIESHRANIMHKLERKTVAELTTFAIQKGIVTA